MAQFRDDALKLISGYKKVTKRQLPQGAASNHFNILGIKSRQLMIASNVELYHVLSRIQAYIHKYILKNLPSTYEYSGIAEFKQQLEKLFDTYILKNNAVTHKSFAASRALLHALQLITAPTNHKNNEKLEETISELKCYGTREQLAKMIQALQKHSADQKAFHPFIETLMQSYQEYGVQA